MSEPTFGPVVDQVFQRHNNMMQACDDALYEGVARVGALVRDTLKGGNSVFACGNGGSAGDAQHLVSELVGRFVIERRGYSAIALNENVSVLTALSNDYGYENVFARQLEALAKPGDTFVWFSTSGTSPNVLVAVEKARKMGMSVVGFTGEKGKDLSTRCDAAIVAPATETARIQEFHLIALHCVCEIVDSSS